MIGSTPWLVAGFEHSDGVARSLAYVAASGNEGITKPADLRVLAQTTPAGSVRVMGGTASMLNKYAGGSGEMYLGKNNSSTNVTIAPTSSAGSRTDLVIMRILDPNKEGSFPSNPDTFDVTRLTVIQGVSASIKNIDSLNLNFPAIALAKVTLPASTATVTQAMITDLRELANPREDTVVITRPIVKTDQVGNDLKLNDRTAYPDGEWFPNVGGPKDNGFFEIDIPKWATRMQIRMEWLAVRNEKQSGWGQAWVAYGPNAGSTLPPYNTQAFMWDSNESNTYRSNIVVMQERPVLAAWRGTNQPFVPKANRRDPAGGNYPGSLTLDSLSGIVLSVRFLEVPDLD